MEIISASRIACLVDIFEKIEIKEKIIELCKEGFWIAGTVFGSTGRFEATEKSDFEYIFLYYPGDPLGKVDTRLTSRTSRMRSYLRQTLNMIKEEIERTRFKFKEFENVKLCGIVEDWGVVRSLEFAQKMRRTQPIMYFLSYCFFEGPVANAFTEMRKSYMNTVNIEDIVKSEYVKKLNKSFLKKLLEGQITNPDPKKLQRTAINTVQALALYELRGEGGLSLIDEVLTLYEKGVFNFEDATKVLKSILEVYHARLAMDRGEEYNVKDPTRFEGFKIALEKLESKLL